MFSPLHLNVVLEMSAQLASSVPNVLHSITQLLDSCLVPNRAGRYLGKVLGSCALAVTRIAYLAGGGYFLNIFSRALLTLHKVVIANVPLAFIFPPSHL